MRLENGSSAVNHMNITFGVRRGRMCEVTDVEWMCTTDSEQGRGKKTEKKKTEVKFRFLCNL